MKKYISIVIFLLLSFASFCQTDSIPYQSFDTTGGVRDAAGRPKLRWLYPVQLQSPLYKVNAYTFGTDTTAIYAAIGLKQNLITLTTTGTSGAATFNQSTGALNIPQYGGGGGSPGGSDTYVQYNNATTFGGDSSFRWKQEGLNFSTKSYTGLWLIPNDTARANTDTLIGLTLTPKFNTKSRTGVRTYDMKVNRTFITMDSTYTLIIGSGDAVVPSVGSVNWFGYQAGYGATVAYRSNFSGYQAGQNATNANTSNFFGYQAGQGATNANQSNFFGLAAGNGAAGSSLSNFFGPYAGLSTSASNSNFFGSNAGGSATNASSSNFFGPSAGQNATNASLSNFFGSNAGNGATGATLSNFFGQYAGRGGTTASQSNFFGYHAGDSSTSSGSIYIGSYAGYKASGNNNFFMGLHVGDGQIGGSTAVTGSSNIVIGTNITTPTTSSNNTMNIGGILFGSNLYSTTTGAPSNTAVSTGRIGVITTSPNSSFHDAGSFATAYSTQSTNYTATDTDHTIEVTATGQTITLPTAVGITGREYVIKLTASGTATVGTTSSQTIDGSTTYSLSAQYKYVKVQSNGSNWVIIGNN